MPLTYSAEEILQTFDTRLVLILLTGGVVFVGAFTQYLEAIRLGFRDKTHTIPIYANMYFFAHDILFVLLIEHWFVEVGHWLYKVFWVGLFIFTVLECVVHYQTIKYSRAELFPDLTQRQYIIVYFLLQIAITVLFVFIWSQLDDPLFLFSFALTEVVSNMFNIPMLMRRRSRKGQSFRYAAGLMIGSNIGYFFLFLPTASADFIHPVYIAMGITVTVANLTYMWLLTKYPPYEPETASMVEASS